MDFKDDFNYENSSSTSDLAKQANENQYDDHDTKNNYQNRYEKMKKSNKKGAVKGILTAVTAGVVGSVLTLTVLPHTDYFQKYTDNNAVTQQVSTDTSGIKTVSAQPTVTSNSSIPDIVENVSKTIVGIDNYQQQNNSSSSNFFGNFGGSGGSGSSGSSGGSGSFGSSGGFGGFGNNNNNSSSSSSQQVETGSGSGVIFQKNGDSAYIVTNNHVVEGASKLEISLYGGQKTTAQVVGTDALTDLAVLKIPAKYVTNTAVFGNSSALRPGDQVLAIGNPLGTDLSRTVTEGIVSATNRSIDYSTSAGDWQTNVIQTDAAINPGNSGGALIDTAGQVIGINSLKISETGVEGIGFAIPSNDVIPIVNQLIRSGKVERPYLGIGLADLSQVPQMYWNNLPSNVTTGVMITSVDPQSAAAKGGFKQQDVIVSMNGTQISSSADLRTYLYTKEKMGDTVKFGVYRNGKLININVNLTVKKAN